MYEVYIILDPARKGKFCFGNYCFLYKPLYVGKGQISRMRIFKKKNKTVENVLSCRRKQGLEPIYISLFQTKNEQLAYEKEKEIIKLIGRRQFGGILFNFTDGGEGGTKYVYSTKELKERSKRMKYYFNSLTAEQKKIHGQKSLKNRNPINVKLGALKISNTKQNWSIKKKKHIERRRKKKWVMTMSNRTPEQKKITSSKCIIAAKKQPRIYFTIELIDQNTIISKHPNDLQLFGISQCTIYRIRRQKRFNEEYITTKGIKFKLRGCYYLYPETDIIVPLKF